MGEVRDPATGRPLVKVGEGREAEIFAWRDGQVLRLFRSSRSQGGLDREIAAMRAAGEAGAPVPTVVGEVSLDGRHGVVVERIDGPDQLTALGRRPATVMSVAKTLGTLHSALHEITAPDSLPATEDQLARRIEAVEGLSRRVTEAALATLGSLPRGDRLCHGDFHPGNVLITRRGPVIIDWTNASRGHPAADVSRTRLLIGSGELPPGAPRTVRLSHRAGRALTLGRYERAYRRARSGSLEVHRRWDGVNALARLAEGIEEERPMLLRRVRKEFGD